jgi:hypothetical protein
MSTVANAANDAASENAAITQVMYVLFRDTSQNDHRIIVVVSLSDEQKNLTSKAKDLALAKVARLLDQRKTDRLSLVVLTQEEYEASELSNKKVFQILYQNGRRRHCRILAPDKATALTEFNQRVTGILLKRAFPEKIFQKLQETGEWKYMLLEEAKQN